MNLRNEPIKKKRGRPENQYALTLKGYLYVALENTPINVEQFYDNLVKFAEKRAKKGTVPCIVFDNSGGSFTGVTKNEN